MPPLHMPFNIPPGACTHACTHHACTTASTTACTHHACTPACTHACTRSYNHSGPPSHLQITVDDLLLVQVQHGARDVHREVKDGRVVEGALGWGVGGGWGWGWGGVVGVGTRIDLGGWGEEEGSMDAAVAAIPRLPGGMPARSAPVLKAPPLRASRSEPISQYSRTSDTWRRGAACEGCVCVCRGTTWITTEDSKMGKMPSLKAVLAVRQHRDIKGGAC
jgi:hypothetical protein